MAEIFPPRFPTKRRSTRVEPTRCNRYIIQSTKISSHFSKSHSANPPAIINLHSQINKQQEGHPRFSGALSGAPNRVGGRQDFLAASWAWRALNRNQTTARDALPRSHENQPNKYLKFFKPPFSALCFKRVRCCCYGRLELN